MGKKSVFAIYALLTLVVGGLLSCNKTGLSPDLRTTTPYLLVTGPTSLSVCSIDPTSGALTSVASISLPCSLSVGGCQQIATDPFRGAIFTSDFAGDIFFVNFNARSQTLTLIGKSNAAPGSGVAALPSLGTMFFGNTRSDLVESNYTGGVLAGVYGSPFAGIVSGPLAGALVDNQQQFIWSGYTFSTGVYSINNSGILSLVQILPIGLSNYFSPQHYSGNYIYNDGNPTINVYAVNRTSGALTQVNTYTPPVELDGLTADPQGHFVFALDSSTPQVTTYSVNSTGSALTQLVSSIVSGTAAFETNPQGTVVYSPAALGTLNAYAVNPTTGALTLKLNSSCGPNSVTSMKMSFFYH